MTSTNLQERLPSDRSRIGLRGWMMTLVAATLLVASGNALAQIPALPVSADHRTDIATPVGSLSADKHGNVAQVCANAYPSVPALPLPVAVPGANAAACADADLDQLRANARGEAGIYGLADPTGLVPSHFGFGLGADADDRELDLDAETDSGTAQRALDAVTDTVKSAWSVIRGLF